jgi:hypothetical protein
MFRKKVIAFVLITTLVAFALLPSPVKTAGTDQTVEGTITLKEIDGTIIITPESGNRMIVYVMEDTRITRNRKPAKLEDLRVGDKIWATYGPDRSAKIIRVNGS